MTAVRDLWWSISTTRTRGEDIRVRHRIMNQLSHLLMDATYAPFTVDFRPRAWKKLLSLWEGMGNADYHFMRENPSLTPSPYLVLPLATEAAWYKAKDARAKEWRRKLLDAKGSLRIEGGIRFWLEGRTATTDLTRPLMTDVIVTTSCAKSVEEIALEWYARRGWMGVHTEGEVFHSLLHSLSDPHLRWTGDPGEKATAAALCRGLGASKLLPILEMLRGNARDWWDGMPDLVLYRNRHEGEGEEVEVMLVEVKSRNDQLRPEQLAWLDKLLDLGVAVRLCKVVRKREPKKPRSATFKKWRMVRHGNDYIRLPFTASESHYPADS